MKNITTKPEVNFIYLKNEYKNKLILKCFPIYFINLITPDFNKSNFIRFIGCKPRNNWHFAQRPVHLIDFNFNIDEQTSSPNDCI